MKTKLLSYIWFIMAMVAYIASFIKDDKDLLVMCACNLGFAIWFKLEDK